MTRGTSVFELRMMESDVPEGGVRLLQQRLWYWCIQLVVLFFTWAIFNSATGQGPRRVEPPAVLHELRNLHPWCDSRTGQCGWHDDQHHPIRKGFSAPSLRNPA